MPAPDMARPMLCTDNNGDTVAGRVTDWIRA
jgi:hypothetical protein